MTSKVAKAQVFRYAMTTWRPLLIIDEAYCNHGLADIFILKENMQSIEVEIKVTLSDLTHNEIKKSKYRFKFWELEGTNYPNGHITNFFYFMVPECLKDKALKFIKEKLPFAGLISQHHAFYGDLFVIKRAKKLHDNKMTNCLFMQYQSIQARKYAWTKANELDPINLQEVD